MAARNFVHGGMATLDRGMVMLCGTITGAGASALSATDCNGFSVARTDVGKFTITLEDAYTALYGCSMQYLTATPNAADPFQAVLTAETVATTKTITFETWDLDTTAATDITSGDKILIQILLRTGGGPRKGS